MDLAFVVDPLDTLKAYKDSSIAMMRAASRRGHHIHAFQQSDLMWRGRRVTANALPLTVHADHTHWHDAGPAAIKPLEEFDAVLMRKDPPFDMEYVSARICSSLPRRPARACSTVRGRSAITMKSWRSRSSRNSSRRRW